MAVSPGNPLRFPARLVAANTPRPGSGSFTLIEVLITLVILSTGIVLVLGAFETAVTGLDRAHEALWANMLIREKMSEAMLVLEESGEPPRTTTGRATEGGVDFVWRVDVRQADSFAMATAASEKPMVLNEVKVTALRPSGKEYEATTYFRTGGDTKSLSENRLEP